MSELGVNSLLKLLDQFQVEMGRYAALTAELYRELENANSYLPPEGQERVGRVLAKARGEQPAEIPCAEFKVGDRVRLSDYFISLQNRAPGNSIPRRSWRGTVTSVTPRAKGCVRVLWDHHKIAAAETWGAIQIAHSEAIP